MPGRRDWFGSVVGFLVFLGGVALMLLVFRMAYGMFNTPPREALGLRDGQAIEVQNVGPNLVWVVVRILLLLVMGIAGSLVANRGISMYTASRAHRTPAAERPAPAPEA